MTREEAIQVLKEISATLKSWNGFTEYPQAIDMAIEALSEPSGDLISRADVHKTLSLLATEGGTDAKMLLMDAHEFIDALPSADRPQGEWTSECACSLCGCQPWYERDIHTYNYCPNCGARMRGAE